MPNAVWPCAMSLGQPGEPGLVSLPAAQHLPTDGQQHLAGHGAAVQAEEPLAGLAGGLIVLETVQGERQAGAKAGLAGIESQGRPVGFGGAVPPPQREQGIAVGELPLRDVGPAADRAAERVGGLGEAARRDQGGAQVEVRAGG